MTRSRQTADWGSRAGLAKVIPSSVAVGSGTGSANSLGTITFSGASSVSLNDVFSATYDSYRIVMDMYNTNNAVDFKFRLRVSGSDASGTSDYQNPTLYNTQNSSTVAQIAGAASNAGYIGFVVNSYGHCVLDIIRPYKTLPTTLTYQNSSGSYQLWGATQHILSTSYTGFTFFPGSGNMTGNVSVYGYTN